MRILVTGAAGFIGSHLCRRLLSDGHDVVGLDDLSSGTPTNLADVANLRFEQGDVVDPVVVLKAASGCAAILHHAAAKAVPRSIEEPERFHSVNVTGTLNVLEAARQSGACVVFASSSSIYGEQDRYPVTEDMEPRPRSPYASTKLAGEAYCRAWWHSFGVPTISLRYFNVYGPYQDPNSPYAAVIPRFIAAVLDGGRPVVYGDGEQARDFTFVDDVVDANVLALSMPLAARGRVLNAAGGRPPTSINALLSMIAELTGTNPEPIHRPPRKGDIRRSEADVSIARSVLGFHPKIDIRDGLRRTVEWFTSRAG